jgi:tetratricopeptide (TPR) repeat protein
MKRFGCRAGVFRFAIFWLMALGIVAGSTPTLAQPPQPMENVAYYVPAVENAWKRLRAEVGLQELNQPRAAIDRYRSFYEAQGFSSAVTALKISGVIAQLYWQMLDDRAKALQIYDWALEKYGDLPTGVQLRTDRALVAQYETYQQVVTALPVAPPSPSETVALVTAAPVGIQNPPPMLAALVDVPAPIELKSAAAFASAVVTVKVGAMPADAPPVVIAAPVTLADLVGETPQVARAAPVAVGGANNQTAIVPSVALVAPPALQTGKNVPPSPVVPVGVLPVPVGKANGAAPAPVTLPSVGAPMPPALPSIVAPPANVIAPITAAPVAIAPVGSTPGERAAPRVIAPVNARLAALLGYLEQWRSGAMSWEQMTQSAQLSPDDVILLSATPHAVSLYSGGVALREKLGQTIRAMPELMQRREELPVAAQVVLAESYTREKNPLAETIYKELLTKDVPPDAGWNKELLLVRLGRHYAAMGDFIKAAEANLQIVPLTNNEAWRGDSLVEAARYYTLAGQADKAAELYGQAQKATYGWAQGLALYDQAKLLLSQNKHQQARALLSTPVTGRYADQIQVPLTVLLGASYYLTGDWDKARRQCERAIALYGAIANPLPAEGLEEHVATARKVLVFIEQWQKAPLVSQPAGLRVVLKIGDKTNAARRIRLDIHSFQRIPIAVKSESAAVRAIVPAMERAAQNSLDFSYAVTVQLAPEALRDGFATTLIVTSPQYPDYELKVPLRVALETAAADAEKSR